MKLIIVESPTKAKTISKFLGSKYKVRSSFGHIRDLPKKEMGVDVENNFAPKYVVNVKSRAKVKPLKEEAKKAEFVILATDEDREGEAIAWHLSEVLDISPEEKSRIVFHEITKKAIEKALESPRSLDFNLVDAQQARRVLDRLVGYELSPLLWKKIRRGLSAGRVQSIALRIISEREREIEKFKEEEYWTIGATFKKLSGPPDAFDANLTQKNDEKIEETVTLKLFAGDYKSKKSAIKDKRSAESIKFDLEKATFKAFEVTKKETNRTPSPPFTTSTLQQAAINSLGFSAKLTMMLAQKLYEQGFITYMRTDSTNLSLESMLSARKTIEKIFGKNYALESPRFYKTKSKGAQEAHEAIRPAYPEKTPEELDGTLEENQMRLYRLIWRRMVASQMQPAVLNSVKILVKGQGQKDSYTFQANGSTVKFDGYLKVYGDKLPVTENLLPPLEENESLDLVEAKTAEKMTSPPPRYTEAALVKVMEENGIGRPSTYAPTISTIIDRSYVEKNEEKKLIPLEIGLLVNDLLVEHFPKIVDMKFTAQMEEDLDKIAEGEKKWVPVVKAFYDPFHAHLEGKMKEIKKENILEKLEKKCPECGGDLVVKFGRFGKFIACMNFPKCRYTEKTEDEKKEDQENSGEKCENCGAPLVVKRGRFGSFLGCSKYPECKFIKKINKKTGAFCPKCKDGEIIEKKSKRGRIFYGCSNYPNCDFALWNKPTGKSCEKCASPMVYQMKGEEKCSNKECISNAK